MSQISTFKTIAIACLLLAVCSTAHADFDAKYKAYSGDLDGNGYNDLFLSRAPDLVMIPYDDLTIPIAKRRAEHVVLMQSANKTFTVNSAPSAANVATMKTWAPSPVQLTARDLNVDGQQDIFIKNFAADPKFLAGTADQIVYAGNSPTASTAVAVTQAMRDFFTQIHGWILDRDYFINTALDNDWYHYNGNTATGWWFIEYINSYYSYSNGTKHFLDATDDPDDINNVPAFCQDFPSFCRFSSGIDKGTEDENELMDWYYFGLEWALYDVLHRDDPSSQVKAVIGEGEGQLNVYNRIPSAAAAWGAIYFGFGVDPETGRQAPFSSEPFPWPPAYDKFQWSMNSGWLAALMGKQAQFYDIQLYGPRTNGRGKFYPCERKILQGYPLREERSWQGTVPFTGGACAFF